MLDIDGNEIYEGDVVEERVDRGRYETIQYTWINWKVSYSCWLRGNYNRLTPNNIKQYKIKVVGNVFENNELLTKDMLWVEK